MQFIVIVIKFCQQLAETVGIVDEQAEFKRQIFFW